MTTQLSGIDSAIARRKEKEARARAKQNHVAACLDEEALAYIGEYFECNMCAFRGDAGSYDPLDAMRRDAQREVYLRLREWRARWKKANQ